MACADVHSDEPDDLSSYNCRCGDCCRDLASASDRVDREREIDSCPAQVKGVAFIAMLLSFCGCVTTKMCRDFAYGLVEEGKLECQEDCNRKRASLEAQVKDLKTEIYHLRMGDEIH